MMSQSLLWMFQSGFPVLMPDRKHASHGNIHVSIGQFIYVRGLFQHLDDLVIHLNRFDACMIVDGLNIVDPLIIIVNII